MSKLEMGTRYHVMVESKEYGNDEFYGTLHHVRMVNNSKWVWFKECVCVSGRNSGTLGCRDFTIAHTCTADDACAVHSYFGFA